jgi:putative heme-binding domain-containing protein
MRIPARLVVRWALVLSLLATARSIQASADTPSSDAKALTRFALEHPGDPARGGLLFAENGVARCLQCHRVRGRGGVVGPDLSDVGAKLRRPDLVEAILDPSRQIVEGYRPTVLALADGRILTGLVRAESAESLTLVDAEGKSHEVRKPEIEARQAAELSIMPDGLAARLSPRDFADLIAYLESLRPPALPGNPGRIVLPPGFSSLVVASGLTGATAMEVAPDSRVFLCEQTGTVRVVEHDVLDPRPFATLKVDSLWERGLIGIALDPEFASNGSVYVCYVAPEPYPHHRISRLAADGTETVLFEGDDQRTLGGDVPAGHQGGAIHFGKDGKLYVAIGDQTAGAPAQSLETLQGKLLRLNRDGTIPEDNPFFRKTRGKYRAIWALGLRNPFTFAVQPGTGRIFINDVGGVAEELNEGFAGANYGWPVVEHGPTRDPRFLGPIHYYPTSSITGGTFAPTSPADLVPDELRGRYLFMDFIKGWIKILDPDHPDRVETFATNLARPVDLRFAHDGSLYVLVRDAWVRDGNFRPQTGSLLKIRTR